MDEYTTLEAVLRDRAARGLGGILFDIYVAAYSAGAGQACPIELSESMRQLVWLLSDRYRVEYPMPAPATYDDLPGWLLRLAQQADTLPAPPAQEWPV